MTTITTINRTRFQASSAPDTTPIVFIVDDDISVRESLELLIQVSGWRAETFASAREFLARPRASVPSCVILDLALPDGSGLDLQQRVAADRPDVDGDLALRRTWIREIDQRHVAGFAPLVYDHGLHFFLSSCPKDAASG